jgi:uncharacterized repeat protein (TIGR01451 family)
MGSGRGFAKSLGAGSGADSAEGTSVIESSGRRGLRAGLPGAIVILLVVGLAILGLSFRPIHQSAQAQLPAPSASILSRTSFPVSVSQPKVDAQGVLGQLPLIFEPNQGQAQSGVKFLARGQGYGLFLDPNGAMLTLRSAPQSGSNPIEEFVSMRLVGANSNAQIAGADPLSGKTNYIIGSDPQQWHRGIAQFAGVRYQQVYPGVDLIFYGHQGHLEYDFRVAPGADASQAQLQFDAASVLRVSNGDLLLSRKNKAKKSQQATLRLRAPQIYQQDGDRRTPVAGWFVLHAGNRVSFEIASYNHQRELVIDPVLDFSTYFGGSGSEASSLGPSVAVNGDGFIYLAGTTTSTPTSFPLSGATPTTIGSASHVFVAKINPSSPPVVVYATFLGGNGTDTSTGVAADAGGNAYLVGNTTSSNFPTTSLAYQTSAMAKGSQCSGTSCNSIFVSVLEASGATQTYASYLSGNGNDVSTGMTIDTVQDVFITGSTTSNNVATTTVAFPATQLPVPFQSASLASVQFFATKVNTRVPGVGGIAYSTYFGGNTPGGAIATGGGIAVDSIGNMYFTGTTNFYNSGSGLYGNSGTSGDFPILNAYQPCLDTVPPTTQPTTTNPCSPPTTTPYPTDAFLAKINPLAQAGAQLLFSTYFGGTLADSSPSVTVDAGAANVYIIGTTDSPDFLLPTGTSGGGGTQSYQTCLNTPGTIVTVTSACPATTTNTDAFVARFTNPSVSTTGTPNFLLLTYFSYLGGGGNETGLSIAVDTASDALFTGSTNSGTANPPSLPTTTGAIQTALNGTQNAFFAHLNTAATATSQIGDYVTYFGGNGVDRGTSIAVDPSLNTYFAGDTTSTNLQVDDPLSGAGGTTLNGTTDDFVVKLGTAAQLCITCVAPVVSPTGSVGAGSPVTVTFTVVNNGPDVATSITFVGQVPNGVAIASGSVQSGSGTCSAPSGTNGVDIICQIPTLQAGSLANVVFNISATLPGTYEMTAIASSPNNTNTNSTTTAAFTATGFTLSVAPSAQTVAAGQAAQYSVVVAPTQGVFGANVSLACSSLPTGASCNFTNSELDHDRPTGQHSLHSMARAAVGALANCSRNGVPKLGSKQKAA